MKISRKKRRKLIRETLESNRSLAQRDSTKIDEIDVGDKFSIGKADSRGTDHLFPDGGKSGIGSPVDTFDKVEALRPGDKILINKKPSIVVDVNDFNAVLTYVADGKATLKDLDYRMAVRYDDDPVDMLPEIEITYIGKGQLPQKLRQPPRKKGPGRSYSVMD